jgi:hypothetical protein
MKKFDREYWYNFYRTGLMVVLALGFSTVVVFAWLHYRDNICILFGLKIGGVLAAELGSDLVVLMPGLLFSALLGFVINRVLSQNHKIRSAIDTLNAVAFLEERDRRIPFLIQLMMFFICMITLTMAFLYGYSSERTGIFAIGASSFLSSLSFLIAYELDDPFTGISRIPDKKIPRGWKTMDIYKIINNEVPNYADEYSKRDMRQEEIAE